jgi:hypothetical protein
LGLNPVRRIGKHRHFAIKPSGGARIKEQILSRLFLTNSFGK